MTAILETTVYMSVTALFILAFKRLFKNKMSARWHVWIWALLAVRLVLPSFPQSNFSVFNAIDIPHAEEQTVNDTVLENPALETDIQRLVYGETDLPPQPIQTMPVSPVPEIDKSGVKGENEQIKTTSQEKGQTFSHETAASSQNIPEKQNEGINIDLAVKWIYGIGVVLLLVYFVSVYTVLRLKIGKNAKTQDSSTLALLEECKQKVGVKQKVSVLKYGNNPMLMGVINPKIVLPDTYSDAENRNIIIHELCHLKSGDVLAVWLSMLVLCLNWYNPIMWFCFFMFRRDIEVYCDERVLKYVDSKKEYAALLVKTALKRNSFIAGTTSLQNGEKEVERRVKYMAYFKKPHFVWTLIVAVAAVVIGVVCLTNPKDDKSETVKETSAYDGYGFDIEQCKPLVNIKENCIINETVQLKGTSFKYIVYHVQSQMSPDELTPEYSYYNVLVFKDDEIVEIIQADADTRVYGYDITNTVLEADVNFDGKNDILVGTPDVGFEKYTIYLQTDDGFKACGNLGKMNTIHINPKAQLFTGVYDGKEYKSFRIAEGEIQYLDYVDEAYTDKISDNTIELHEYAGVEVYPYLNEFFPHLDGDVIEYTGEFLFDESADFDGKVQVEKIKNTNDGIIYCLNILNPGIEMTDPWKINPDCSKIYLLVTKKEIFLYESYNGGTSTSLIMSPDADEFDIPSDFTNDGTTCEYHNYNPNTETGFYETFIFEKGVGLVEYKRGYGAGRDHVELKKKGYESEKRTPYTVRLNMFTDIDESVGKDVTINYPVLMYHTENALSEKINETIKEAALSQYYDFLNQGLDFNMTIWPVNYTVEYMSDRYISVLFEGYYYTKGTAHGFYETWAVTVDLTTGEKVYLFDVFNEDFYKYIDTERFTSSAGQLDLDETEQELLSNVFAGAFMEFENNSFNNFHFTNDKFHIIHNVQDSGFCFAADYESLKDCMKDHPIWQELGVKTADYSEVYDKDGKVMESSKYFLLEDRTDEYYYEVYDNDGKVIYSGSSEKSPVFIHLEGPLYELRFSQGTFAWESVFFNVEWGDKTDTVDRPFYLSNGVIAYLNELATFDSGYPTKTGELTFIKLFDLYDQALIGSIFAKFLKESTSYLIEYIDDTHISVTYYTENGNKENVEVLEIPSLTGALTKDDFKITYKGFTFDFDTTVDEVLEYFPTEEIENISYVSGSPEAKRICLSYPNAREPDINIICIQNHETGEQFIETIVILGEDIETARGMKPKDSMMFVEMNYGNGKSFCTYGVISSSETYYYGTEGKIVFVDNADNDSLINHISFAYRPDSPESRSIDLYQKSLMGEDVSLLPIDGEIELLWAGGAGGWGELLNIKPDGSFWGEYQDSNIGDYDENKYPGGTVYIDRYEGEFGDFIKLDNYTYLLTVLQEKHEFQPQAEWIEDGIRYISTSPEQTAEGNQYILCLPGKPVSEIPRDVLEWHSPSASETFLSGYCCYPAQYPSVGFFAGDYTDEDSENVIKQSEITVPAPKPVPQPTPAPAEIKTEVKVPEPHEPETVPEVIPEVVPEVTPEVTPETTPEVIPEVIPETTPETPSDTEETTPVSGEINHETETDASGLFDEENETPPQPSEESEQDGEETLSAEVEVELETDFW